MSKYLGLAELAGHIVIKDNMILVNSNSPYTFSQKELEIALEMIKKYGR